MTPLRDSTRRRFRARWPWLLAVAAAAVIPLGYLLRGPVAERLWPEAEAEALRQQAEAALREGRLSADDGSGARELYEAALAIDPDRAELRAGLTRVAHAALARARAATVRGDVADAHRQLQLARALSAPRAQADAIAEALRDREAAVAGIDGLLRQADAAREAGRLDGDDAAALPLYGKILRLQPRHLRALEGREDALSTLLEQARTALRRDDVPHGAALIAAATAYDAGHADLPETQAALAQAVERCRRRADDALRAGRLERALAGYRQWRDSGLEPAEADAALDRVARAYALRARAAAADFEFERAHADLAAAAAIDADLVDVRDARDALRRAERARDGSVPKLPPKLLRQRLRALIAEAEAAEGRGDWLTPPGESAFDKLRAARALAPDDADVAHASGRVIAHARDCFERELRDNRLQRARVCLDARIALEGDRRVAAAGRARLAQRWVAVGEERLGGGDLDGARAAQIAARSLAPEAEGLADFTERLRVAETATH